MLFLNIQYSASILFTILLLNIFINLQHTYCAEEYQPDTYAYILQADRLSKKKSKAAQILKDSNRDLIIIDPFFTNDKRWSKHDITQIRSGKTGRKIVAYISIGEAEDYRYYWLKEWSSQDKRPDFIQEENPDWEGNFKVKYWKQQWQDIIIKELKKITAAGFDGVFLDIIDGFEYFEDDPDLGYIDYKINPETGNTYRADMIRLVDKISKTLNQGEKNYLIIPQNGAQLLESPLYQNIISMLALESLFTDDNTAQPIEHTKFIMNFVTSVKKYHKSVLLTEYPTKKKYLKYSRDSAAKYKLTLLQTNRALSKLGKCYPENN